MYLYHWNLSNTYDISIVALLFRDPLQYFGKAFFFFFFFDLISIFSMHVIHNSQLELMNHKLILPSCRLPDTLCSKFVSEI